MMGEEPKKFGIQAADHFKGVVQSWMQLSWKTWDEQ